MKSPRKLRFIDPNFDLKTLWIRGLLVWQLLLREGKLGRTKYRRIPKCEGDKQGRVPKCSLPPKLFKQGIWTSHFSGISPKLFSDTALRRIQPYLPTPVPFPRPIHTNNGTKNAKNDPKSDPKRLRNILSPSLAAKKKHCSPPPKVAPPPQKFSPRPSGN